MCCCTVQLTQPSINSKYKLNYLFQRTYKLGGLRQRQANAFQTLDMTETMLKVGAKFEQTKQLIVYTYIGLANI